MTAIAKPAWVTRLTPNRRVTLLAEVAFSSTGRVPHAILGVGTDRDDLRAEVLRIDADDIYESFPHGTSSPLVFDEVTSALLRACELALRAAGVTAPGLAAQGWHFTSLGYGKAESVFSGETRVRLLPWCVESTTAAPERTQR